MAAGKTDALLGAIGLCRKAGKLIVGTDAVCLSLREKKKPCGVLAAADVSENTAKRLRDKCESYRVPLYRIEESGEALAAAIGKGAKTAAVAVTDGELWRLVLSRLEAPNRSSKSSK